MTNLGEGNGNPFQYSGLENHRWRSPGTSTEETEPGYSPRGHKESDKTERLHFTS